MRKDFLVLLLVLLVGTGAQAAPAAMAAAAPDPRPVCSAPSRAATDNGQGPWRCQILTPPGSVAGVYSANIWPNGIVPYQFDFNVNVTNRERTVAAMQEIEAVAAVRFIQRTNEPNYVHVFSADGNFSNVGRIGGRQDLGMRDWSERFVIVHELMHTLGFWHEQQRNDRDNFIQIKTGNFDSSRCDAGCIATNFGIASNAFDHGVYDFDSVMHYSQCAFSRCTDCSENPDDCRTITVLPPHEAWQDLIGQGGQLTRLSKGDMAGLRFLYPPIERVYVDADASGANNGTNWLDALHHLQDALFLSPREIWVAEGTYMPDGGYIPSSGRTTRGNLDREATFQLVNGTALYGGFAGWETELSQRDIKANETILGGDLLGNDIPVPCTQDTECEAFGDLCLDGFCIIRANNEENSYHVVTGSGTDTTAVIDGFTMTAANADGPFPAHDRGAGMLNLSGSPTVSNCVLRGNWGDFGGGMFNDFGSPSVCNCTLRTNAALEAGGMYNFMGSTPAVTDCTFSENTAAFSGGGMRNVSSNPAVTGCTFSLNRATGAAATAGGMYNITGSHPMVSDCTFDSNVADVGGGMVNDSGSSPTVIRCAFNSNSAVIGGGLLNGNSSNPVVSDCLFSENLAEFGGGGMANRHNVSPTVSWCTFTLNTTAGNGGGMYNQNSSNPIVRKCMFGGNTAADDGGAMYNSTSSPTVTHCAFWGNSAFLGSGIYNSESSPVVSNCGFSGNSAFFGGGIYNHLNSDPEIGNSVFGANVAYTNGGGIAIANSTPVLTNCILWGNVDDVDGDLGGPFTDESAQIHNFSGTAVTVNHSIVQGGWSGAGGVGVIDEDPMFVDPLGADGMAGTQDDDLRLMPGSPAINAGDNAALPPDTADLDGDGDVSEPTPTDLDGHPRVLCGVVDMGAYEFGIWDHNCDQVMDLLNDFAAWDGCMTGPGLPGPPMYAPPCSAFDAWFDGWIDLRDFAALQRQFGGLH